ncbi:MAG: hypothetical protein RLZZ127_2343 [Planctomycetota bacterium]|jgi:hypothetical protein
MSDAPEPSPDSAQVRWWVIVGGAIAALAYVAAIPWLQDAAGSAPSGSMYLAMMPLTALVLLAAATRLNGALRMRELLVLAIIAMCASGAGASSHAQRWATILFARPALAEEPTSRKLVDQFPAALSVPVPVPVEAGSDDLPALNRLVDGMNSGRRDAADLPVAELMPAVWMTLPIMAGFLILVTAMAAITARQWMHHERLQQPLGQITGAIAEGGVLRNPWFLLGAGITLAITVWNMTSAWEINPLPKIVLSAQVKEGYRLLGMSQPAGWPTQMMENLWGTVKVDFLAVGMAFLLSAEMGFSLWGGFWLGVLVFGWLHTMGIPVVYVNDGRAMGSGAMLAMAGVILWLGRLHYLALLKAAFGRGDADGDHVGVWGLRIFLAVAVALGVLVGWAAGHWAAGVLGVALPLAFALVLSRVVAEAGVFSFQAASEMGPFLNAIGLPMVLPVSAMFMVQWIGITAMADTREAYAGHIGHASGLVDRGGLSGRAWFGLGALAVGAAVVALAAGLLMTWTSATGIDAVNAKIFGVTEMTAVAGRAGDHPGSAFLGTLAGSPLMWGVGLVLGIFLIRRAWNGFPFNPLGLAVAFSFPIWQMWGGLALGWLAKVLVLRFGGASLYATLKPMAIGLIIGELGGRAVVWTIHACAKGFWGIELPAVYG